MPRPAPNLLFIMTDHQRADSLGTMQAGIEVTPNLNRLAAQSTAFDRAYNTCPLCVPARTAIATGKYPTHNGVVFNDWRGTTAGDHLTLHECLARAGYDVAHMGVHHVRVKPDIRERVPFAKWVGNADHAQFLKAHDIAETKDDLLPFRREIAENQNGKRVPKLYSNTHTAVWPHPVEWFKDNYLCDQAIEFLREPRDKPFALFVCLWAPHPPLRVPEPYASLFAPDAIDLPANVGQSAEGEPLGRRSGIAAQLAEGIAMDQWRRVWAAHLGLVHLADAGIGRILDALDNTGGVDDTITCFTVDHGDQLGQHCMYQKMEMYEQAIRIPLLVRVPGAQPTRCDAPVSHLDILPTLAELMDLAAPPDLDGISLAPSVLGDAAPPDRPVFSQYTGNPTRGDTRRALITRRWKYIHDPTDAPELYDLENDPLEMTNLDADPAHADTVRTLHNQCRRWHQEHGDTVAF